jgi:hypothetical protein
MTGLKRTSAVVAVLLMVVARTGSADLASQAQAQPQVPKRKLWVDVVPKVSQAPAVLRIQALVDPVAENRELEFALESDGYYRSSTIELSGAVSARFHSVEFRSIPGGRYLVRVAVRAAGGVVRAVWNDQVVVIE